MSPFCGHQGSSGPVWVALLLLCSMPMPSLGQGPTTAVTSQDLEASEGSDVSQGSDASQGSEDELLQLERLAEDSFVQDDLETAIVLYRQLQGRLQARSEKVRILMTIAWLEHLRQQNDRAQETLVEAFVLNPDYEFRPELYSESFRQLFVRGQQQAIEVRDQRAADRISQGFAQLRAGDYGAARRVLQEALRLVPNHPKGLYNLALVDLYDQRSEEAVAGFQKLLALADSGTAIDSSLRALSLTNLGYLFIQQGNYEAARSALEQAVALDAGDPSSWSNLGVARRRLEDPTAAAEAFQRAYQLDPDNVATINHLALAYIDAEDWRSAVALLRQASGKFPDNASLWLYLGLSQLGLNNGEDAVQSLQKAIQQDPDDRQGRASAAAIHLAQHYYGANQVRASLQAADQALAWRPELVNGWIYRGLAQRALGDAAGALESLQKARSLDPSRAETHNNLGSVYADQGRMDEAKKAFEQALSIDPTLEDARQNLNRIANGTRPPRPSQAPSPPPRAADRRADDRRAGDRRTADRRAENPVAKAPPLGLRFADIDYSSLGLKGAMVEAVNSGSVAERGGLRSGDLILKVDGQDVSSADQLRDYVATQNRGSQLTLDLLRANVPQRLVLTLE